MTLSDLFGQIGGVLGFFMGISIFSLLQVCLKFSPFTAQKHLFTQALGFLVSFIRKELRAPCQATLKRRWVAFEDI